jgi:hypothetical protein
MPASPKAPKFFVGKNEKQPISPRLPARRPSASSEPIACDDGETVLSGDREQGIDVGHLAVQMHRHDRPDAAPGCPVDQAVIAAIAFGLDELGNGGR